MSSQPLYPPTVPSHFFSESVVKCLLTNTLSLTNKIREFHQLAHDTNPHLICITETWLTSEIPDGELLIPGLNLYCIDSSCGSHAFGVGLVCLYTSSRSGSTDPSFSFDYSFTSHPSYSISLAPTDRLYIWWS